MADEVHLLDSPDRGPTLEVTLARLMQMNPDVQIIALSATVGNAQEMAQWLDAALVESEWRPIDLQEGVFFSGSIKFQNSLRTVEHKYKDDLTDLVYDTLNEGGQCLVFESSRRNAEASARRLGQTFGKSLGIPGRPGISESSGSPGHEYSVKLDSLANQVLDTGETEITRRLAQCVRGGAAFHHAGLLSEQRKLIEDGFRNNLIKVLSSTPTLAAGLNMPARRVIIRSYRRYDPNYGMVPIPVLEYKQMAGRAGRPGLDPYGESVLISKSDEEMEALIEQYVNNDAEDIYSKLGTEGALRTHILSTVSTRLVKSREELMDFLGRTFFGHQQDTWTLAAVVDEVIEFLVTNNLIIDSDGLHPTELGELVTRLYIDPMSASTIVEGQGHLGKVNMTELTLLQLICNTPNMRPLYLRNNDYGWLDDFIQQHNDEFVAPPPPHSSEYEWFMSEVKTAVLLLEWISESKEDDITSRFNIGPGDIRAQADTAQWLMHSTARIFAYLGSEHAGFAQELVERISYGAAKELLPIIKIKGIGRVRSRKLYNAGYKDIEAIRKAEFKALADIIGPKIAANTLRQLGVDIDEKSSDFKGNIKAQQNLKDF